jgi:hypothetical protein
MRVDCMVAEAETIRDWPEGEDRTDYAMRHLREARLHNVLGNLSQQEQYRIFSILSFAMPSLFFADDDALPPKSDVDARSELQKMPEAQLTCEIGCEACEGGRMLEG